jgi:RND family efflux transporter MFP subunit
MNDQNLSVSSSRESTRPASLLVWVSQFFRLALAILILGGGVYLARYWMENRPKAQRRPPQIQPTLVDVSRVETTTENVVIRAMGTVEPARTIQLAAQVSGKVVDISPEFVPGGYFKENERVLKIDPRDYELAVQQRQSDLAKAESDLKVEMGQQSVAQSESELLSREVNEEDKELLLRKPQLAMAEASVDSARAALDQAELDLERTVVRAPFNSMIQSRSVDLGSQVSAGMTLANLVGTDVYWIQVSVPVDELKWMNIPGVNSTEGSRARVYYESAWGTNRFREGQVVRLLTDLEPEGRMARLLVSVKDPLHLNSSVDQPQPLILGSYVRVEIQARPLSNVIRVPRTALHDGNRVWVMKPDKTLEIRETEIVWSDNEHVCISGGLTNGDLLITSDLGAPVDGMKLRTADAGSDKKPGEEGRPNKSGKPEELQ